METEAEACSEWSTAAGEEAEKWVVLESSCWTSLEMRRASTWRRGAERRDRRASIGGERGIEEDEWARVNEEEGEGWEGGEGEARLRWW
jgi:hypothetical protein